MPENKQQQPILIASSSGVLSAGVHSPITQRGMALPSVQNQTTSNGAALLRGCGKSQSMRRAFSIASQPAARKKL